LVGLYLALVEEKKYGPGFRSKLTGMKDTTLAKYPDYQPGFYKGKLADFVRAVGTLAMVLEAP
jgi:hypothetical protein